jgi:hypothetical protein
VCGLIMMIMGWREHEATQEARQRQPALFGSSGL